jgi:hypothetical protein
MYYQLAESMRDKKVRCRKCQQPFLVTGSAAADDVVSLSEDDLDEALQPADRPLRAAPRRHRDEDEDDWDDDRPRGRRRGRRRQSTGVPLGVVIGGGVAFVLVLVAVVLGAVWYVNQAKQPADAAPAPSNLAQAVPQQPVAAPVGNSNPQQGAQPAPQPEARPNQQFQVTLSHAKIHQGLGPRISFSVDYQFNQGSPVMPTQYFLVIEPARGQSGEARFHGHELAKSGTMHVSGISFPGEQGPFELSLEAGHLGGFGANRQRISNTVKIGGGAGFGGIAGGPPDMGGMRRGNPPPQPPPPPKVLTNADIDRLLTDLKSGEPFRQQKAAIDLRLANAEHPRRKEIAVALEANMGLANFVPRDSAAQALAVWAVKDNVPALLKAIDHESFVVRDSAMEALGKLKEERAAEPLAKKLPRFETRAAASKTLKALGPGAESAVLPYLEHEQWDVRLEACQILKEIGGAKSVPALEKATSDSNGSVALVARQALDAARGR